MYRYYDGHGVLIYVGITSRATGRNSEHNKGAEWWPYVTRQEVEHHPSREVAHAREVELIRRFRPPFNKQHNIGGAEMKALYVAFRTGPEPDDFHTQYKSLANHALPLEQFALDGTRYSFRTHLTHAAVAQSIKFDGARKVVVDGGPVVGSVLDVLPHGMFVLIVADVSKKFGRVLTAEARMKVTKAKPPVETQIHSLKVTLEFPVNATTRRSAA